MRTLLAFAAACPLVLALSVVATPAHARDCEPVTLATNAIAAGPSPLAIGTTEVKTLNIAVHVHDPCSKVIAVQANVDSPREEGVFDLGSGAHDPVSGMSTYGLELDLDPATLFNAEAGAWTARLRAHEYGKPAASALAPNFSIRRAARLKVQVPADPVAKGTSVTVTGSITRANWEEGRYRSYAGRTVDLQFRTVTGIFQPVKTVKSDAKGQLSAEIKATQDGCFRLTYGGNRTTGTAKSDVACLAVS